MRDVLSYMEGDPEDRWADAQDFLELAEDYEDEEIYGEAKGRHPLANGAPCRCDACRGRTPSLPLCNSQGPRRGMRCARQPNHGGACSALTDTDQLLEWDTFYR